MLELTRRQLLKSAAGALCAAAVVPFTGVSSVFAAKFESDGRPTWPPASLGRVTTWGVEIREQPQRKSKLVRTARRDEVLRLYQQLTGDAVMPHNATWYKTDDGYVYSSWVQPVEDIQNPAEPNKAADKFWGELTVPFSDSRVKPDPKAGRYMRLYYSSVYRIIGATMDKERQWWYQLQDGITWAPGPYVPAAHIRRIDPSELTPISPEALNKHIEVDLKTQTITAFENGRAILTARVASGYGSFRTPSGKHKVLSKSLASRMTGGVGDDYYDLPGVPFPTYITQTAVAIHGAYWHNDYGHPRSHGCLNVMPSVARWFWRWTQPVAPYDVTRFQTPRDVAATLVEVA